MALSFNVSEEVIVSAVNCSIAGHDATTSLVSHGAVGGGLHSFSCIYTMQSSDTTSGLLAYSVGGLRDFAGNAGPIATASTDGTFVLYRK